MKILCGNARQFNEDDSNIHIYAEHLEEQIIIKHKKYTQQIDNVIQKWSSKLENNASQSVKSKYSLHVHIYTYI